MGVRTSRSRSSSTAASATSASACGAVRHAREVLGRNTARASARPRGCARVDGRSARQALGEVALAPKDRPLVLALQLMVTRTATLTPRAHGPRRSELRSGRRARATKLRRARGGSRRTTAAPPNPPRRPCPAATPTAGCSTGACRSDDTAAPSSSMASRRISKRPTPQSREHGQSDPRESRARRPAYRLVRLGLYLHSRHRRRPRLAARRRSLRWCRERQQIETLTANGKWEALIDESESSLGMSRFGLDLHRFTHTALGRLGDAYAPAAQVVLGELRGTAHTHAIARRSRRARRHTARRWATRSRGFSQTVLAGGGGPRSARSPGRAASDERREDLCRGARGADDGQAPDACAWVRRASTPRTTERQRFVPSPRARDDTARGGPGYCSRAGSMRPRTRASRSTSCSRGRPETRGALPRGIRPRDRLAAKAWARGTSRPTWSTSASVAGPERRARLAPGPAHLTPRDVPQDSAMLVLPRRRDRPRAAVSVFSARPKRRAAPRFAAGAGRHGPSPDEIEKIYSEGEKKNSDGDSRARAVVDTVLGPVSKRRARNHATRETLLINVPRRAHQRVQPAAHARRQRRTSRTFKRAKKTDELYLQQYRGCTARISRDQCRGAQKADELDAALAKAENDGKGPVVTDAVVDDKDKDKDKINDQDKDVTPSCCRPRTNGTFSSSVARLRRASASVHSACSSPARSVHRRRRRTTITPEPRARRCATCTTILARPHYAGADHARRLRADIADADKRGRTANTLTIVGAVLTPVLLGAAQDARDRHQAQPPVLVRRKVR